MAIQEMYENCKVYTDGSHYIAIPPTLQMRGGKKKLVYKDLDLPMDEEKISYSVKTIEPTKTQLFDELYKEYSDLTKAEKKAKLIEYFTQEVNDSDKAIAFVEENWGRIWRNVAERRKRMVRKAYLQRWDYFCTFTYDDKKHSEESFRKSFSNCLRHFANRRGWKYIGVWEKSPNDRLHFHCLLKVPQGQLVGEIVECNDYDTRSHRMRKTFQNTFFNEKYGRSDFESIHPMELPRCIGYLTKYLTKPQKIRQTAL